MLSRYWKAIIAFLSLFSAFIVQVLSDPNTAALIPPSVGIYLTGAIGLIGTWLVWLKRNQHNIEDLERIATENGLAVTPKAPELP